MSTPADLTVDTKGLCCPLPILKAKRAIDGLQAGQILEVVATDPGSMADFKAWTRTTGHELLEASQDNDTYKYTIRKKA